MASKFEEFLTSKKIDLRQLLAVSTDLEALRPEDRAIKLAKRRGKTAEAGGAAADAKKEVRKVRSGRSINKVVLAKIAAGKPISGPTRTRILRAVNAVLERKKQAVAQLGDLFDLSTSQKKKKKPEAKAK